MTLKQFGQPPYFIEGNAFDGRQRATRTQAASALVLAMKWEELGHSDVIIRDASGVEWTVDSFRRGRAILAAKKRGAFYPSLTP